MRLPNGLLISWLGKDTFRKIIEIVEDCACEAKKPWRSAKISHFTFFLFSCVFSSFQFLFFLFSFLMFFHFFPFDFFLFTFSLVSDADSVKKIVENDDFPL